MKLPFRESCRGKFKTNKILTIHAVYIQECLLFLFKNRLLFEENWNINQYDTRTLNYNYPRHRLTMTEKNCYYCCLKFYNKLPKYIKEITQLTQFKKSIYELLLQIEPYSVNEYLSHEIS